MSGLSASIFDMIGAKSVVAGSKKIGSSNTLIPAASNAAKYVATEGLPSESSWAQMTAVYRTYLDLSELLPPRVYSIVLAFFGLGGDSIMSIQLSTAAKAAGLVLTPKDIFERLMNLAAPAPEAVVRIERQGRRAEVRWGDHGDARIAIESGAIDPARRAELLDLLTGFLDRS